jgi:hypothetical protein
MKLPHMRSRALLPFLAAILAAAACEKNGNTSNTAQSNDSTQQASACPTNDNE